MFLGRSLLKMDGVAKRFARLYPKEYEQYRRAVASQLEGSSKDADRIERLERADPRLQVQ